MVINLKHNEIFKHSGWQIDFHIWNETSTKLHSHDFYELFIVLDGTIKHNINKKIEILKYKTLRFIRPQDLHEQSSINDGQAKTINISFTKEILMSLSLINHNLLFLQNDTEIPIFEFNDVEFNYINSVISQIIESPNYDIEQSLIKELIILCGNKLYFDTKQNKNLPEWLNDFIIKINNPLNFDKPVNNLYSLTNYSPSMISITFNKYLGQSLVQYYTTIKINYACNLLRNTDEAILSISNNIGYSSLSHFIRVFKKHVGLTPTQYKLKYLKNII